VQDRLVSLQFMVGNAKTIPKGIPVRGLETPEDLEKRKTPAGTGSLIIPNVEKIDASEFILELIAYGYELVDAFQQERTHKEGG